MTPKTYSFPEALLVAKKFNKILKCQDSNDIGRIKFDEFGGLLAENLNRGGWVKLTNIPADYFTKLWCIFDLTVPMTLVNAKCLGVDISKVNGKQKDELLTVMTISLVLGENSNMPKYLERFENQEVTVTLTPTME